MPERESRGPQRIGAPGAEAGVRIREWIAHGVVDLLAGHERIAALRGAIGAAYRIDLPPPGRAAGADGLQFLRTGAQRWQVRATRDRPGWIAALRGVAGDAASVIDQSCAARHFDVDGPRSRDALAKGLPIDLHPLAFKVDDCASTMVAHVTVSVHRLDDGNTFRFGVPRSYAGSWLDWLYASAAEFGCEATA
ncbi:MAG: sarcosine oxidase, gamma subunit [Gammaproteobacteria bacterium]|nr:sarcosine oxidase, gamma subunit [Gammaproteobacteria bacterium]